jgi:CBS domain-containing protein
MKISEVMTRSVKSVTPDQSVRQAAELMRATHAGSIPVCDGDRVVGIVTDRDIAIRGVAEGLGAETPVRKLMSERIVCVHESDHVEDVAQLMYDEQIRRVPVLDEQERLCGIVSLGDLSHETGDEPAHTVFDGVTEPGGKHEG